MIAAAPPVLQQQPKRDAPLVLHFSGVGVDYPVRALETKSPFQTNCWDNQILNMKQLLETDNK